ncbi:MAG: DUF1569 domain-containing protein [Bacteroidota bacterium]
MKTLFDSNAGAEIILRINKLTPSSKRVWGKMDVAQMLAHCSAGIEMQNGDIKPPRVFIGKVIGPFFKSLLTNEKPFRRNTPTAPELMIVDEKEFEKEKERLIGLINRFVKEGKQGVTKHPHPFFGKLKEDEWGMGAYKHLDHHLQQFGV